MKDTCAKCARPFELGDERVQLAPDATYHAGCSVTCPLCPMPSTYAAGALLAHMDVMHPLTTFADELPSREALAQSTVGATNDDARTKSARQLVLDEAGRIISSDRNSSYGEPEDNLGRISQLWSVLFERDVTPREVAWAMVLVKVAREVHAPHADNPVDVAGYAALAGELG